MLLLVILFIAFVCQYTTFNVIITLWHLVYYCDIIVLDHNMYFRADQHGTCYWNNRYM